MLKLRVETGRRQPPKLEMEPSSDPAWIEMALRCIKLQAVVFIETGKREVPLRRLLGSNDVYTPRRLFSDGLLDLLTWEENAARDITYIHRVDVSFAAAQALTWHGLLPRCFLGLLIAPDLLAGDGPKGDEADLLREEFVAWIECGGFSRKARQESSAA